MTRTLSIAFAALLATAGSASAQEKFTFALNWFAVGDHAAYWVALDKGYYKAKGLDVTLENSKGCLLYTSPSPRDGLLSRMPSSA